MKTLTLVLSETVAVEEARALESTGGPLARVLSAYVAYVLTVSELLVGEGEAVQ